MTATHLGARVPQLVMPALTQVSHHIAIVYAGLAVIYDAVIAGRRVNIEQAFG